MVDLKLKLEKDFPGHDISISTEICEDFQFRKVIYVYGKKVKDIAEKDIDDLALGNISSDSFYNEICTSINDILGV